MLEIQNKLIVKQQTQQTQQTQKKIEKNLKKLPAWSSIGVSLATFYCSVML